MGYSLGYSLGYLFFELIMCIYTYINYVVKQAEWDVNGISGFGKV